MTMYVLIEHKPEGKITASLFGWPAITAQANSETEAVSALRRSLISQLRDAKLVPLELGLAPPWLQTAGAFIDDPFADELENVMSAHRRERDAEDEFDPTQDHAA